LKIELPERCRWRIPENAAQAVPWASVNKNDRFFNRDPCGWLDISPVAPNDGYLARISANSMTAKGLKLPLKLFQRVFRGARLGRLSPNNSRVHAVINIKNNSGTRSIFKGWRPKLLNNPLDGRFVKAARHQAASLSST